MIISVGWIFKAVPWLGNVKEHHGPASCLPAGDSILHTSRVPYPDMQLPQPRAAALPTLALTLDLQDCPEPQGVRPPRSCFPANQLEGNASGVWNTELLHKY